MKPSTGSGTKTGRTAGSCRAAWPSATPPGHRSASTAVRSISPTAGGPRRRCARARSDSGAFSIRPSWASHGSIWTAGSSRRTRDSARSWGDPNRNCTNCESTTSITRMIWPGTYPSSMNSQKEDRPSRSRNGTSGRMGHRFGSTTAYRRSWMRRAIRTPSSRSRWKHLTSLFLLTMFAGIQLADQDLARVSPTHRSNLERSIRRALAWQFSYLPTAAWRWGRLKWVRRFAAP